MSTLAQVSGQVVVPLAVLGFACLAFTIAVVIGIAGVAAYRWLAPRRRRVRKLLRGLDHHLETHVRNDPQLAEGWGRVYAAVQDEQPKGGHHDA
ncbi:hypothetical protein [Streptomyces chartreusis]|uniref:hypothetical protein n=1 Tax=Streptomyces chartreusis TaxID=1969 RepID=UPI003632E88E